MPILDAGKRQLWALVPGAGQKLLYFLLQEVKAYIMGTIILLVHFVWHLVFGEHVRDKAAQQSRVQKGNFPYFQPGQRC